ncbi:MAG TPA: hypothetical protein VK674_06320, partial [Candidatus Limnocylindria bacterium]|nr:hypothetical protein [Candidatus Limnocylindria bacterium]
HDTNLQKALKQDLCRMDRTKAVREENRENRVSPRRTGLTFGYEDSGSGAGMTVEGLEGVGWFR